MPEVIEIPDLHCRWATSSYEAGRSSLTVTIKKCECHCDECISAYWQGQHDQAKEMLDHIHQEGGT